MEMPKKGTNSFKWTFRVTFVLLLILCSTLNLANSDVPTSSSSSAAAAKDEGSDIPLHTTNNIKPHPETPSDMGSVIPGVYKEYLPQPIFYESVVPAIFQYRTPLWNKTEVTFNNWYQCVTETVPYRYSCPVTFHMNKAIVNLHVDFEGLHPISDIRTQNLQHSMRDYYARLTEHSDFCDKIQKHFAGIWTEPSELEKYFTALQGCARGSELHPYMIKGLEDYNYGIRQVFTKMENNFYNTFYKNILGSGGKNSTMDLVASALLSNTRTSLQGAILGQYYAEKNRWVHANQDCRQGYIPTSLVTPSKFNESLSTILKMSVFKGDTELSIPIGEMSKYYSVPLADCTHTADSMVVRILIPILKKFRGEVFQLVHVHTIPFIYKDHICRVKFPPSSYSTASSFHSSGVDPMMMGENENSGGSSSASMFLFNEFSHQAYPTNCKPNELCKISQYMLDVHRSDPCVSSLLSKNETGIRRHCDFECLPKDRYVLPSVVRVASNKFVVTGSSLSFKVVCGRLTPKEKLVQLEDDQIGAVLVKLPCYCRLIIPHYNVYFTGKGCPPEADMAGDGMVGRIVHAEEEESYEQNEVEVIPIIPFMFGKVKDELGQNILEKMTGPGNHFNDQYDNLEESQLLNLTEIIDRDRIEHYIKSSEIRREMEKNKFKGMDFYAEKLQSGENISEDVGGSGVGGFFWSVFIISVIIILGMQIYIIVIFQRHQRISYSKDDTILYRVEPEDADTTSLG